MFTVVTRCNSLTLNVLLLFTLRFVTVLVVCGDEKSRQKIFNCCGLCTAKLSPYQRRTVF